MVTETEIPTKTENSVKTKVKSHINEPSKYKVIFLNDDKTTVEFVVESLVDIFNYQFENATHKAAEIHQAGSSVVAVYTYELAEQKGIEVTLAARASGFPLQVRIEAEE